MHLVDVPHFCQMRKCLRRPVYSQNLQIPSENGSTLKGKNLLPVGTNSYLLE